MTPDTPDSSITFEQWLAQLDEVARASFGFDGPITDDTGAECWRSYYEDGYTPRDALAEDQSYD
jgi:hypothetical protein